MATDKATSRAGQRLRMLIEQLRREARAAGEDPTQVALGQRLGIGETTLSKILGGTRNAGPNGLDTCLDMLHARYMDKTTNTTPPLRLVRSDAEPPTYAELVDEVAALRRRLADARDAWFAADNTAVRRALIGGAS